MSNQDNPKLKSSQSKLAKLFSRVDAKAVASQKVSDPHKYKEQIREVLVEETNKELVVKMNDIEKYHEALTLYLYGHKLKEIEQMSGASRHQLEAWREHNNWDGLRIKFFRQVEKEVLKNTVNKESGKIKKVVEVVGDLVDELADKAMDHAQDMQGITGKDYVRFALDGLKLKAQLTGEFVDNKQVTVGSAQAFQKIMEMPKISSADIIEGDAKFVEEPKLLE